MIVQVGIDINLAASHEWIFAPLQFIAGLGPRKAGAIQRAIQSAGRVGTRKDLYSSIRVMDKKVFINSAGFIRVRGSGQAASGIQHLDPLDDTRIHPESYQVSIFFLSRNLIQILVGKVIYLGFDFCTWWSLLTFLSIYVCRIPFLFRCLFLSFLPLLLCLLFQ